MGWFSRKKQTVVQDPVCGMQVEPSTAVGSLDHGGKPYYFCSANCMSQFRNDPARFVA